MPCPIKLDKGAAIPTPIAAVVRLINSRLLVFTSGSLGISFFMRYV